MSRRCWVSNSSSSDFLSAPLIFSNHKKTLLQIDEWCKSWEKEREKGKKGWRKESRKEGEKDIDSPIPMTGLFAPHISSVVSKVIWGDKEVSAGAICWSGSSCSSFRENSGSSEKNECKTGDVVIWMMRNGESQNQTHTPVIKRKEYIDPLFLRNCIMLVERQTQLDFLRLY